MERLASSPPDIFAASPDGLGAPNAWAPRPVSIPTRWACDVSPQCPWPEYPRPQMTRGNWENLNGMWEYAITAADAPRPSRYDGLILVPFPLESALSGVQGRLLPDQRLWYRRNVKLDAADAAERVLVHFGAVDQDATVYLNGRRLGVHRGGYQAFSFDVTEVLVSGDNELEVEVYDPTDKGEAPYGKQHLHPTWAFYTANSGIWQTVWLERVPSTYVNRLRMNPDLDRSAMDLEVEISGKVVGLIVEAVVSTEDGVVCRQVIEGCTALQIESPRLWSPEDPFLYDLEVRLLRDGVQIDAVRSYFGMRKVELGHDSEGRPRILLNGATIFNLGVVDQGYWPEGLYTAPTDGALQFDLRAAKALGFNAVRKHIKIEPQRWYAHADRIGLLVWQDMPSGNNDSPKARAQFEAELLANVEQLRNHPSIIAWVLFNEGWGAYDRPRLTAALKAVDQSRLLNSHSGPYDHQALRQLIRRRDPRRMPGPLQEPADTFSEYQSKQFDADWTLGDIADLHYYPGPRMPPAGAQGAHVTGEHGSFGAFVEGHVWDEFRPVGKGLGGDLLRPAAFRDAYALSVRELRTLESEGLAGAFYFQLFDVEAEQQGLVTYDRALAKVGLEDIAELNGELVPLSAGARQAAAELDLLAADGVPEAARYAALLALYRTSRGEIPFLRRLALMAVRQGDHETAAEVSEELAAGWPAPHDKDFWRLMGAIVTTSASKAFELLEARPEEANLALGPHGAERKVLEIIYREAVAPALENRTCAPAWDTLESSVVGRYGELGREAVWGARMMHDLVSQDWPGFARSYVRYFASALGRSVYPAQAVTYQLARHVADPAALQAGLRVMGGLMAVEKEFRFSPYDPTDLDTYAYLLFRLGRRAEAIEWQRKAVALTDGLDPDILNHLDKMEAGVEAWTLR